MLNLIGIVQNELLKKVYSSTLSKIQLTDEMNIFQFSTKIVKFKCNIQKEFSKHLTQKNTRISLFTPPTRDNHPFFAS